jgi:hypothetical protein
MASSTAGKVAAVLAAATAVTHVYGLVAAAKMVPVSADLPAAPAAPVAPPAPAAPKA